MKTTAIVLLVVVAAGLSLAVACFASWALTAIWPSLPFWPVAFLSWIVISVFSRSSASSS